MFLLKTLPKQLCWILLACMICGCNPYLKYRPPQACAPCEWKESSEQGAEANVCYFWELFNDPVLNALEARAIQSNQRVEIARQRLNESSAISRIAWADLFPYIQLGPYSSTRDELTSFSGIPGVTSVRLHRKTYALPIEGSYPIDLWQKRGMTYFAQWQRAAAAGEGLNRVLLDIQAEVAKQYYALRTLDVEIDVLEKTITLRNNQVEINTARYDAGIANFTDVSRAYTELSNVQADLEDVMRSRRQFENSIAVLVGAPASEFCITHKVLKGNPPEVNVDLPCSVIQKRPDIREAERLVAAAHGERGAAWAEFLPDLTLEGTIGYASPTYRNMLSWETRLWAYAINVSQVLFDSGALRANAEAKKAAYFAAIAEYHERVLEAFREVEDALTAREQRRKQAEALQRSVASSSDTLLLLQEQYDEGLIGYLDVVDAERTSLEATRTEVRARGAEFIATAELLRALGRR